MPATYRNDRNGGNRNSRGRNSYPRDYRTQREDSGVTVSWKELTAENYVDLADKVMQDGVRYLTTTKLRSMLTLVNRIENLVRLDDGEALKDARIQQLLHAQVRFAYEAGREERVKRFLEKSDLLNLLKHVIQTKKKADFELFARYFEALVAYHRFHGGKDR